MANVSLDKSTKKSRKSIHSEEILEIKQQIGQLVAAMTALNNKVNDKASDLFRRDRSVSSSTRNGSAATTKRIRVESDLSTSQNNQPGPSTSAVFVQARSSRKRSLRSQDTSLQTTFQLPTSNTFDSLFCTEMDEDFRNLDAEEQTSIPTTQKRTTPKRPPPVVVHDLPPSAVDDTAKFLLHATGGRAKLRCRGGNFSVITSNKEDWQAVKTEIAKVEPKLQYHTYTHPDERKKALVMRGAHFSLDPKAIETELKDKYNIPAKVSTMTKQRKNQNGQLEIVPMPLFQVVIEPNIPIERLMAVRYISYYQVTWEHKRSKRQVTQCHRCQRFGHGSTNCKLNYHCIKCTEIHNPGACRNVNKTEPTVCVNCGENHPANF